MKNTFRYAVHTGNVPIIEIKNITNYDAFLNTIIASGLETHCIITGAIDDVKEIRARNSIIPVMTIGYTPAPYTDNLERITEISENRGILYNYPQVDQAAIDILHQQNISAVYGPLTTRKQHKNTLITVWTS